MQDVLEDDNQAHQAECGNARDLGLITEGCDSSHRMLPIYLGSVCSVDIGLAWRTSFGRADRSTDRGTAAPDTLPSVPTMCYPIPETKGQDGPTWPFWGSDRFSGAGTVFPTRGSWVRVPFPAPEHIHIKEGWAFRPAFFASKRRPSAFQAEAPLRQSCRTSTQQHGPCCRLWGQVSFPGSVPRHHSHLESLLGGQLCAESSSSTGAPLLR